MRPWDVDRQGTVAWLTPVWRTRVLNQISSGEGRRAVPLSRYFQKNRRTSRSLLKSAGMGHNYYGEPAWPSDVSTVNIYIYSLLWHLENEGWIYIKKMWERKRGKEAGKDRGGWDRRRTVQRFWPFLLCRKAGRCGREASVGQAGLGRDSSNLILFYFSNCPRLLPHLTTSAPHSTNLY